jgi:hypothetical protein
MNPATTLPVRGRITVEPRIPAVVQDYLRRRDRAATAKWLAGYHAARLRDAERALQGHPDVMWSHTLDYLMEEYGAELVLAFAHDPALIATPFVEPEEDSRPGLRVEQTVGTALLQKPSAWRRRRQEAAATRLVALEAAAITQVLGNPDVARTIDPLTGSSYALAAVRAQGFTIDHALLVLARDPLLAAEPATGTLAASYEGAPLLAASR